MNIIARNISMEAKDVVETGVELYGTIEQAAADIAQALIKLHDLHDDAYRTDLITGTEAMEGKGRVLSLLGAVGDLQIMVMAEHVFAAEKAKAKNVDIATPYRPLPAKIKAKSGGGGR